jgi:glycosyltransferase involved in cell wall biosynthesis
MIAVREAHESVLVVFGADTLYGLERGVIEIFDRLRPEVDAQFLVSRTGPRLGLAVFREIERRRLPHVFFSDDDGWERLARPKSLRHGLRVAAGLLRGNLDVLREVRRARVLYVPSLYASCFAVLGIAFCRLTGRRVMLHFHELVDAPSAGARVMSWFVTDVIHNSDRSAEIVLTANPSLRSARNFVIPYPLPTRSAANADERIASAFPSTRRHLIVVGRVSWRKGIDVLLDAFERLARSCRDVTLHVVGACDEPDLESRLATASFANGCRIHNWGYRDDVLDLIKRADVYVMPTPPSRVHESFGIGMLEAMSLGVPGVSFASGALEEIVANDETGLLVERETPEALAAALARLLADNRLRRSCGDRARRRFLERYSPQLVKARWLSVLAADAGSFELQAVPR